MNKTSKPFQPELSWDEPMGFFEVTCQEPKTFSHREGLRLQILRDRATLGEEFVTDVEFYEGRIALFEKKLASSTVGAGLGTTNGTGRIVD